MRGDVPIDQDGGHPHEVPAGDAVLQAAERRGGAAEGIALLPLGLEEEVRQGPKERVRAKGVEIVQVFAGLFQRAIQNSASLGRRMADTIIVAIWRTVTVSYTNAERDRNRTGESRSGRLYPT